METGVLLVAVEYRGADLAFPGLQIRTGFCEHVYDLNSATLIGHAGDQAPRVGFPVPARAWNSEPEFSRCPACDIAVESILRVIISTILRTAQLRP